VLYLVFWFGSSPVCGAASRGGRGGSTDGLVHEGEVCCKGKRMLRRMMDWGVGGTEGVCGKGGRMECSVWGVDGEVGGEVLGVRMW
jgi:hypothetical protein